VLCFQSALQGPGRLPFPTAAAFFPRISRLLQPPRRCPRSPAEEKAHGGKKVAANVKGNYKNSRGQYLLEHDGNHWYIIDDAKHGQPYFFDANRNVSQWEDPRGSSYDTFGPDVHSEL
jgi:hypothetical protein